jgi:hypothetical protein
MEPEGSLPQSQAPATCPYLRSHLFFTLYSIPLEMGLLKPKHAEDSVPYNAMYVPGL